MPSVPELLDDDPAWPLVSSWLERADGVRVLPTDPNTGHVCLHALQVTTRSVLGALAAHTGGVLVDHGWLRMLGSGAGRLIGLAAENAERLATSTPGHLVVAHDVLGGRFAIDGGALLGEAGEVAYWAPDSLRWEGLGIGHSAFVRWALSKNALDLFYRELRWPGWIDDVAQLDTSEGIACWPPLWTAEYRSDAATTRQAVPWAELVQSQVDVVGQIGR